MNPEFPWLPATLPVMLAWNPSSASSVLAPPANMQSTNHVCRDACKELEATGRLLGRGGHKAECKCSWHRGGRHPQTKHSCNLISVSETARVEMHWAQRETAEVTDLLQGGPQLRIVALQLAPVNFQLCHCLLQKFKPLCQPFLLLHSRTRLSLYYLQGRPMLLIWAALQTEEPEGKGTKLAVWVHRPIPKRQVVDRAPPVPLGRTHLSRLYALCSSGSLLCSAG